MQIFLYILVRNILPIFFIIGLGFLLNKKFNLNIYTLSKLNFYIFAPCFAFYQLYTTKIPLEMIKVVGFVLTLMALNYIAATAVSGLNKFDTPLKNAFRNSVMFYNSGNFGIPLVTLVFSNIPYVIGGSTPFLDIALTTQVLVLVTQNITIFTVGFYNAGRGSMNFKDSIKSVFSMPSIYAVPTALLFKALPYDLTQFPIWPSFRYIKEGMVATALLTLGVQLSKTRLSFKNTDVYQGNLLRLLGGPVIAYFLVRVFNFNGVIAQTLMISSAVPTAVVTALIAVEKNNEPEYASQVVLTSTAFSCITLSIVVYVSRLLFPVV